MIELIVVMAILAVLCGVLVPNALGWIKDSKLKTCNSEAKTVFNTAVTVLQDYQLEGKVSQITDNDNNIDDYITKDDNGAKHKLVCDKINAKLGSNFSESYWAIDIQPNKVTDRNSNTVKVVSAVYGDSSTSIYVGRYPLPANESYSGGIATALSSKKIQLFNTDSTKEYETEDILYDKSKS
jgi:type II secretory pathway pseudopilin PulG